MVTQTAGRRSRVKAASGRDLFMVENEVAPPSDGTLFPATVGERLRAAREAAGFDFNDIATKTRVPKRHLEAIERGDYSALPSPTYAVGFTRAFARAVGLDDVAIARDTRSELGRAQPGEADNEPYEPVDPARLPSRLLAWTAALLAVVLLAGYLIWRANYFGATDPAAPPPESDVVAEAPAAPVTQTQTPTPAPTTGTVVLTATAPVWLRIYDKANRSLVQKELAAGESFTVPADADTPMIRTGRPEALRVTVDGRDVAPLGAPERTVRDVVLTAAALAARPEPAAPPPLPAGSSPATVTQ